MMWSASALGRRSVMVVGADNFITSEITSAAHHQTTAITTSSSNSMAP